MAIKNKLLFQLSKKWLNESSTPEEILDVWMESYIDGWVELELEN